MNDNTADDGTNAVNKQVHSNTTHYNVAGQTLIHHTTSEEPRFRIQCDGYGFSFDTYTIKYEDSDVMTTKIWFYLDKYLEPVFGAKYSNIDDRLIDVLDELTDDN